MSVFLCLSVNRRFGPYLPCRYDPHGFELGDGVDVRGSMICMPNSFVLWKPKTVPEITIESLRILELVIPKIGNVNSSFLQSGGAYAYIQQ